MLPFNSKTTLADQIGGGASSSEEQPGQCAAPPRVRLRLAVRLDARQAESLRQVQAAGEFRDIWKNYPPILTPLRRREGWRSAQCQTWQIISAVQLSLPPRGDYLARLVHNLSKSNAHNTSILQPKKLAFKVESSPEDENFNTSSAANSSVMDSSLDSNGGHKI